MSYTKNTWETGDIVTAEKLNHMENGIASAGNNETVFFYLLRYIDEQTGEVVVEFDGEPQPTINDMVEAMSQNKRIFISLNDRILIRGFYDCELFYSKEQEYFTAELEKSEIGELTDFNWVKFWMEFILYFDTDTQEYQFDLSAGISNVIGPVYLSGYMRDSTIIIDFEILDYIFENEIDFSDIQIGLTLQDQSGEVYRLSYINSSLSLFKCRVSDEGTNSQGLYAIHKVITCTHGENGWEAQYTEHIFQN